MSEHSDSPRRDWGLYGLVVAVGGILALLIFAEGRALSAQQKTEAEKLRAEMRVVRAEQSKEAEETRRYVAEKIARANERAGVNSIRIDHLEQPAEPLPGSSPPAN